MKKRILASFFLLCLIILVAGIYYSYTTEGIIYSVLSEDTDSVIEYINSFGSLAALILILLVILEVIAAPIPPLLLYVVAGIIFGKLTGGLLVLTGNLIGATIAFLIARTIARDYISKKIDPKSRRKFDKFSEKYGTFAIFFLRINPITSSDIFSYIAGLSKMKLSKFLIGTTLGLAPLVFLQTYLGADIIKSNPLLLLIFIIVSIAYFLVFLYLVVHFMIKRKKQ